MHFWKAQKNSRGTLVIVHGLGEHAGRYEQLAKELNTAGYSVISADLPGHGKSPGQRGHIRSFEDFYSVVDEMLQNAEPPLYLMGHSLGGLIALRYIQEKEHKVEKLVLSNPALKVEINPILRFILAFLNVLAPRTTFDNRINVEMLSRNKDAVKRYVEDKLVHRKVTARLVCQTIENIHRAFLDVERVDIPTLLILSTSDRVVPPEATERFFESLRGPKKLLRYEGCYHEPFEDPEYGNRVTVDIIRFLEGEDVD